MFRGIGRRIHGKFDRTSVARCRGDFIEKRCYTLIFDRLFPFALCAPVLADVQENPLGQRCVQYRLKKRPNRVAFIAELIDGNDGSFRALQPQRMLL